MDRKTREFVRSRAGGRCEYCLLLQENSPLARLQIEHIIPRKHDGTDDPENLALACIDCNLAKSSNLSGIDPESGRTVELFHPRLQSWDEHFVWGDFSIVGLTETGRATVRVLNMNTADRLRLRIATR